jgi:phosphoglycolate phosphatase-like HAD superfamily hydrolase
MKLILDLDVTLLDYRARAWHLFDSLTNGTCSRDFYLLQKSFGVSNFAILETINPRISWSVFDAQWKEKIESFEFLEYDKVFKGVLDWLRLAKANGNLMFLCTARRNEANLLAQLKDLGILDFFTDVIVTFGQEKGNSLSELSKSYGSFDWFISDSPNDILVGQNLGLQTCSVASGFRSLETLKKYSATLNINSILEFDLDLESLKISNSTPSQKISE